MFDGRQKTNAPADCFLRRIAKELFSPFVPTGNDSVRVEAHDCVVGRFNDGGVSGADFIGQSAFGHVDRDPNVTEKRAALIEPRNSSVEKPAIFSIVASQTILRAEFFAT